MQIFLLLPRAMLAVIVIAVAAPILWWLDE